MKQKKIILNENSETNDIRLNKFLSDAGVCSRREADRLIEQGKVTVNGIKAVMGQRVYKLDEVFCDGRKVSFDEEMVLLLLNKPEGIECTTDKSNRDNVIDFINYPKKVFYVGRLDKNSCGLLLLTNDGDLANKIAKSVNGHEKEYIVKVNKKITGDFIEKMSNGVRILDTITKKCSVARIDDYTFKIILTQGLNRQIRRMCEALSYKVVYLQRIRIMNLKLGNLKLGTYRNATSNEVSELLKIL